MTAIRINIENNVRHKKLICSTRQGKESTWYTGKPSEVRNGTKKAVGTPQWVPLYEMYRKKDLYTR